VWAVGDVRASSVKRVAAAVGDGAQAVASIHKYLAATSEPIVLAQPQPAMAQ
jgi:thioredoxin reductase (NADPH)